jgi:peptide/nickel transport system ATP-binding protein
MNIIEANNLKAYYITQAYGVQRNVKAVDDISLQVKAGEVYGIAGESGCGKSTLLRVLLGIFQPPLTVVGGTVKYNFGFDETIDALALSKQEREEIQWKKISYIPQGSMHVLNPVRKIKDTFRDFVTTHQWVSNKEADTLVGNYLRDLGLPARVLNIYPHQLSGGMRQRVTIALATILWPKVVFADEPTTALDVIVQRGVIQLLKEVQQREQNTLVLVTHDMGVHANLADRVAILYAGKIVEEAETRAIFKNPLHPYTQYLIKSLPKLDDKSERLSIPGRPPALDSPPTGCRFHPRCPYVMEICRQESPPLVNIARDHKVACYLAVEEKDYAWPIKSDFVTN